MHISRYERIWMYAAGVMIAVFFVVISLTLRAGLGFLPTPAHVEVPPSAHAAVFKPGVEQVAPGRYDAHLIGQMWQWLPTEVHLPVGAEVTFYVTSKDVMHGFEIEGTDVNATAVPGQVAVVRHRFDQAGRYQIICNEYCGIGHALMEGDIIVGGES